MINVKAALNWVLIDPNVHTAIPAFSNFDEMRESLSVMEDLAAIPEEERDFRLGERLGFAGNFCQKCDRCLPQCPARTDAPPDARLDVRRRPRAVDQGAGNALRPRVGRGAVRGLQTV